MSTATSPTGDAMLRAIDAGATFTPTVLDPGQSTTVPLTITPAGASGTVVRGTVYVDDYLSDVPPNGTSSENEVSALPYEYTIK